MKYAMLAALTAVVSFAAASAQAAEPADEPFAPATIVANAALAKERGGTDPGIACTNCIANGMSVIRDNAFQNAVGVFTVVQNTGNQVFLDTVTVVTVSIGK